MHETVEIIYLQVECHPECSEGSLSLQSRLSPLPNSGAVSLQESDIKGTCIPNQNDFPIIFGQLKSILKPYAENLTVKTDTPDTYYLDDPYSEKWKKQLFFASTQIKKNYVSFYLMLVYTYPELLKDI